MLAGMAHITMVDRPPKPGKFPGSAVRIMIDADIESSRVTMGESVMEPGAEVPSHRHRVEEAFYIIEGNGVALVGDNEIPVTAGDALLTPAGELHGFRNDSSGKLKMVFFYPTDVVWAHYPGLETQPEKLTPYL
jgi:quercetin dioxygenase-like cupin family protein